MCSWWLLYLLVPVFIGVLLTEYKSDIFRLLKSAFAHDDIGKELDILVFVPSARSNFEQRLAIRDTWLKHVKQSNSLRNKVSVHFVVGQEACNIPPEDRINLYCCDEWAVSSSTGDNEEQVAVEPVPVDVNSVVETRLYGIHSLPFTVLHPVVITKLGIHGDSIGTRAQVRLLEASSQKEIVSALFTKESKGVAINSFQYRTVQPYFLPKGFEGVIVGENLASGSGQLAIDKWNVSQMTRTNNGSGVLQYSEDNILPDGHYYDIRRWKSRGVHIVSFLFQVQEVDALKQHVGRRSERLTQWHANCTEEDELLSKEQNEYNDMMLVDVIDFYRNVPNKFLHFAVMAVNNFKFRYILKTDDDCFVDVERILMRIRELGSVHKTWFGRFRHNWMVEKYGKWAEHDYPSVVYPKFACGSGYLLSYDLVVWLANNADKLKAYQGEDVSMGIWLAAVGPHYIDEPLWQCDRECLSDMYVEPQLAPDELRRMWSDWETCHDPCGCS